MRAPDHSLLHLDHLPFQVRNAFRGIYTVRTQETEVGTDLAQPLHHFRSHRHLHGLGKFVSQEDHLAIGMVQ